MSSRISRSDAEWRARLSPLQYIVTRKGGMERPGTGSLPACGTRGTYACVCCGARLYDAMARTASDSGHPCFRDALPCAPLDLRPDHGWMTRRTRIGCSRCGAQLGFLVGDGDAPALHQINACALRFAVDAAAAAGATQP